MPDESMLEVMDSEHHLHVTVAVDSFTPRCNLKSFVRDGHCAVEVLSRLTIRGNERAITLPGTLSRRGGVIELAGKVEFSWQDFRIEDRSILMAKLRPEMSVTYTIMVPASNRGKE